MADCYTCTVRQQQNSSHHNVGCHVLSACSSEKVATAVDDKVDVIRAVCWYNTEQTIYNCLFVVASNVTENFGVSLKDAF